MEKSTAWVFHCEVFSLVTLLYVYYLNNSGKNPCRVIWGNWNCVPTHTNIDKRNKNHLSQFRYSALCITIYTISCVLIFFPILNFDYFIRKRKKKKKKEDMWQVMIAYNNVENLKWNRWFLFMYKRTLGPWPMSINIT